MSNLLEWKERLQTIYAKYSTYIDKGIRFILAIVTFTLINMNIGFMDKLASPLVSIGLAVVCAFLPVIFTVVAAALLTAAHLFSLSIGILAIAAVLIVLMFIFYFRFTPKHALILLLTPLAFALKVPALIAIGYGLSATPVFIIPVIFGTAIYYLITYAKTFANTLTGAQEIGVMEIATKFAKQFFMNKELWVALITITICLLLVYFVKRMSVEHSWKMAIISGTVAYIAIMIAGEFIFDLHIQYISLILGSVVSGAIGFLLEIMMFSVNYAGTEYLQFEDDEYYYYIKAVPKVSVTVSEKTVKCINSRTEVIDTESIEKELKAQEKNDTEDFQNMDEEEIDKMIEETYSK